MAKILVVEDERVAAWSIQESLEGFGHTLVAHVTSGSEAIRTAGETQPDLVLMDTQLKGTIDGVSAAEQIRSLLKIPIIYLTAHANSRTLKRAIASKSPQGTSTTTRYLVKPFNQADLHTTIEIALLRNQFEKRLEAIEHQLSNQVGDRPPTPVNTAIPKAPIAEDLGAEDLTEAEYSKFALAQAQEQTAQIQQKLEFEILLNRITNHVRDSLDESQILQIAVQELATALKASCNIGLYDLNLSTATIAHESLQADVPSAQPRVVYMKDEEVIYSQLLAGKTIQFCGMNLISGGSVTLACPLIHDSDVIGDIWLERDSLEGDSLEGNSEVGFGAAEVHLVQQVANQCAIAIRQARLYAAAQQQITELESLNQVKDDFLTAISHELRTPICSIKMASQLLEIRLNVLGLPETDQQTGRYLQILQSECDREINLINNMLDLSRLDTQMEPIHPTPINLQDWIPHLLEPFAAQMQKQQQQLVVDLPVDLSSVVSDLASLGRILTELFNNAFKYTPAHETIKVSAAIESREVPRFSERTNRGLKPHFPQRHPETQPTLTFFAIRVSNSGVKILPSEQARIFEKFYRVPNTDPWKHGGAGLGLALVKRMVSHINGEIQVVSKQNWTTFTVYLPLD